MDYAIVFGVLGVVAIWVGIKTRDPMGFVVSLVSFWAMYRNLLV